MMETQSEIRDLALSVNSLAGSVKRLVDDMCKANARLDYIESRPRQVLNTIINLVLGAVIGGSIAFLLNAALH
jgi:capsular polysaccharide biosynthesis protein